MIDLKDMLTQKAIVRVEAERDNAKPDFNDLGVDEAAGIRKRVVRGGKSKIVTTGRSAAQKLKNTGLSKIKQKLRTRKTQKTKKRTGALQGSKKHRANIKRKRSLRKGGHR